MRSFLLLLLCPAFALGCGGSVIYIVADDASPADGAPGDGGTNDGLTYDSPPTDDSPPPPPPLYCNGQPCGATQDCIHPAQNVGCSMCVGQPDGGYCEPPSHLGYCGGPVMFDGGMSCVVDPPPPGPPFCSDGIPQGCYVSNPTGRDLYCEPAVCAQ